MPILYDDEYKGPRYRYGLQFRPISPGSVPKGFIIHSDRPSDDFRHGTLDYPVKLPDDRAANFELVFIGEFDTEGYFSIKRTSTGYCQVCGRDFITPELVYFAPIDGNIVCSECAHIHQDRQLRIYVNHDEGGCANGCIVPKLYRRLALYEDATANHLPALYKAAPDMYEALKAIVNWYEVKGEMLCTNDQPYELLKQALRKAEGRTDRG